MKRVIDVDMECVCKKVSTALNRFFKKYPELNYWREQLDYMADNGIAFDSDQVLGDGSKNTEWSWALHLDIDENFVYIAVIERA